MARILYCDDDLGARDLFTLLCNELRIHSKTTATLLETLQELQSSSYEAIILDLQNTIRQSSIFRGEPADITYKIKDLYPGIILIGMSATPERFLSTLEGHAFDEVIEKEPILFDPIGKGKINLKKLLEKHGIEI